MEARIASKLGIFASIPGPRRMVCLHHLSIADYRRSVNEAKKEKAPQRTELKSGVARRAPGAPAAGV